MFSSKNLKVKLLISFIVIAIGVIAYYRRNIMDLYAFGKAVHEETKNKLIEHKAFFKTVSFSGIVKEKNKCEECPIEKYQLLIYLNKEIPSKNRLINSLFKRYYFFKNGSELNLSVTEEIFETVRINDKVLKKPNSLELRINDLNHKLLSEDTDNWFED